MRVRVSEPCAAVHSAARRRFTAVPDAAPAVAEGYNSTEPGGNIGEAAMAQANHHGSARGDPRRKGVVPLSGLEPTALARAEWLKYIALFVNEERQATALHDATSARYRAISARALGFTCVGV